MYTQRHLTQSVIMVRPHDFGFNEQTGLDNEFQHRPDSTTEAATIRNRAMHEFDRMVDILDGAGVEVLILDKPDDGVTVPDAVFPNNWFSTREDGNVFIYPMKTPNRQAEVQIPELESLLSSNQYQVNSLIDLRARYNDKTSAVKALEGTGSLIFHHPTGSLFAAISERCDPELLKRYADEQQYQLYAFTSNSRQGAPIYHTNVLMSCGENFAVIADEILTDDKSTQAAMNHLADSVEDLISITEQQMTDNFCGNILQLQTSKDQPVILMSESARKGFTPAQIKRLERHGELLVCPIPTIEYIGGGSARCMVAENFLPRSR